MDFVVNKLTELFKEHINSFDSLRVRTKQKDYFEKSLNGFFLKRSGKHKKNFRENTRA
jgi:hypothetical protein